MTTINDILETPENIPPHIQSILKHFEQEEQDYEICQQLDTALLQYGYTIDFDLSGTPINLTKINN